MKYSTKFNLAPKIFLKRLLVVVTLVALCWAVPTLIKSSPEDGVSAATADGGTVKVETDDSTIHYAGHETNKFTITSGSSTFTGFCANPSKLATRGDNLKADKITSTSEKYELIRMIIYIYTTPNSVTTPILNGFFQTISDSDLRYAWIHAIIGYIYANETTGLNEQNVQFVENVVNELKGYRNDKDHVYIMSKNYQLYSLDPSSIQEGHQDVVWIEGNASYGKITVKKCDVDNNGCNAQGKGSFSGVTFTVYNNSGEAIYNPQTGTFYNNGAVVATGTTGSNGTVEFDKLLLGSYKVSETGANDSYVNIADDQTVNLTSSNSSLTFKNRIIRGDVSFTKTDTYGQPMANVPFRITSKTTGENHIVVSDSNGVVDTSATTHSFHTNGYDSSSTDSITYQAYGTWFGKDGSNQTPVNDSLGALPFDEYEIAELSCDANKFCYSIDSQKKSFSIVTNNQKKSLGDWENDCQQFTIGTTATDASDNDKILAAAPNASVKDTISYCAKPGMTYTIKGFLMDKTTGRRLTIDGQTVPDQTMTLTPTVACGTTEMTFTFDASSLAGKEVVVYEQIMYEGTTIASHGFIGDGNQTVSFASIGTTATDNKDNDKYVIASRGAKIKDVVHYCVKPGMNYIINGTLIDKATGEPLTINGNQVTSTANLNNPSAACGDVEMLFELDASSLAGKEVVVFESIYTSGRLVVSHEDLNDGGQTIDFVSIGTTATDNEDNDKFIVASEESVVKDTIRYCVKPGINYTINGILIDKATGEPVTINGNQITNTANLNATSACGNIDMLFELDSSEMAGKEVVVFESIYIGDHLVVSHEDLNDNNQAVSFISIGTTATDNEDDDKYVVSSEEAVIKDTIHYCVKPGVNFIINGTLVDKATGEPITIKGDQVANTINLNVASPCGDVEMLFRLDASEMAGAEVVVFESVYTSGHQVVSHEDLEDEDQTVSLISIGTTATNADDGDKKILASEEAKIKDTISYCLKAGEKYKITGILMNKSTGEPLIVNGRTIVRNIEIEPEEACGEAEMVFEFDASNLGGAKLVVFETVKIGNNTVISHEDIDDVDQTVDVYLPPPDTGLFTAPKASTVEGKNEASPVFIIGTLVAIVGFGYTIYRITARRKFLR